MRVIRENDQAVVVADLRVADRFWTRFLGWMTESSAPVGSGLWITPCNSVHTWMMSFSIDIVFLDGQNKILKLAHRVRPWCLLPLSCWRAHSVLELPAGTTEQHRLREGDLLCIVS